MGSDPITQMIRCDAIFATDATQVRVKLSKDVIDDYTAEIKTGAKMPAIVCFSEKNSERIFMADGFHRHRAHINAELEEIEVDLRVGNKHDALEYALSANRAHGLRMTNADKVRGVKMALADSELAHRTQQEIADMIGITREAVNRISRRETLDKNKATDTGPGEPEDNKPDNQRSTMPAPTQAEVERGELRAALGMIKAFPYEGADALKLELSKDDIADLEYVSAWCAHAVIAYRKSEDFNG